MAEEDWGNGGVPSYSQPSDDTFEQGRAPCRGKGRGAALFSNNDDRDSNVGGNNYNQSCNNENSYNTENYKDNNDGNRYNGSNSNRRFDRSDKREGNDRPRYGNRGDGNENDNKWQGNRSGNRYDNNNRRNRDNDDNENEDGGQGDRNYRRDGPRRDRNDTRDGRGGGGGYGRDRGDDGNDGDRRRRRNDGDGDGPREDKNDNDDKPKREIYIPKEDDNDESSLFGNEVAVGINFSKYDDIKVKVSGENAPSPIMTFDSANLRSLLLENIKKSGYTKPTPVQRYAIPIIMAGRDMMACAQTGSGKTAAFMVPIIHTLLETPKDLIKNGSSCEPQVIIVSPTRELAIQIHQQARKFALNSILQCQIAYGGTSVMHQGNKVSAGCHILVATPGRLLDYLGRGRVRLSSVRFLVLDEADRMLDMGFIEAVGKIIDHETMTAAGERQTLMFSATFPNDIQELAARFLKNYLFLAVGIIGGACADVEQNFYQASGQAEKRKLLREIVEKQHQMGNVKGTLVFVEQKRFTDFIAAFLSESNIPTTSIHGDRLQREREEALSAFKTGNMYILVATAVAARGLDIKNVCHVINFDMPQSIDEYVHRIGRTGRVGNRGKATSFFDANNQHDVALTDDLVKILKQAEQPVPDWLLSGGGGGSRTFGPGRGTRRFGGEDIRDNNAGYGGTNDDIGYTPPVQAEPEEAW